jgi:flotillin
VRRELESLRLNADVVVPSEVRKEAAGLKAAGDSASIAENGRASAESLRLVADAWKRAGASASDMFLINNIEEITKVVVGALSQIELGPVQLIDGGDGQALPRFAATYPAAVATVMHTLAQTTGVDITALLSVNAASAHAQLNAPPAPSGGAAALPAAGVTP